MRNGAEPSFRRATAPALRVLPSETDQEVERREALVRRLAADRIRELRDDGVTMAYVARMYEVEPELLERVFAELKSRPR
jgi:hypothetical protein